MDFDDLNEFLGKIDQAKLDEGAEEEDEEPMEYEPVEGFDFHTADPLSDHMLQYHHPQLNWLLRELANVKSLDGRDYDKIESKNSELQVIILELVRAAKTSEKEGNQWRAEYEAQVEINNKIGDDILKMTDRVEYIKGLLSNADNLFAEYDGYSEMKWRKTLRKLDKELKEKEATLRDLEHRLVEEIKAFTKQNSERSRLLVDVGGLSPEELKMLADLEKQKAETLEEIEREKANPSPRKNILEDFKNRKQKIDDKKREAKEHVERAETATSRPGGRYTGRTTPRGGTMNLAKGVRIQRDLRETETDPFLRRGVYGNRIAVDRRGGPDPVAALFNQSKDPTKVGGTGLYSGNILAGNDDDYAEFLATPRVNMNTNVIIADDKRVLDASKGPVKKSSAVRSLPKI